MVKQWWRRERGRLRARCGGADAGPRHGEGVTGGGVRPRPGPAGADAGSPRVAQPRDGRLRDVNRMGHGAELLMTVARVGRDSAGVGPQRDVLGCDPTPIT